VPNTTFRSDDETEAALEQLTAGGATRSEAIRQAILDAAKAAREEEIKQWAAEVMADPAQVAITKKVNRYTESIRAR
jgi:predicted transcriptional regulator